MGLFDFFSPNIGIDLGTSNTLVYVKDKGITVDEPSVVGIKTADNSVCAVGAKAKEMLERTPHSIVAVRPLQNGVIADFDVTRMMIRYFMDRALNNRRFPRAKVVICVPVGVTSIERKAVEEVAYDAGAKKVKLVEEPMAAAIGAGLPVHEALGSMVVDIGGGTTEIAILSLGGIVVSESVRIAGDDMDANIKDYVKWKYKLDIGLVSAEKIKKVLGNACAEYYSEGNHRDEDDDQDNEIKSQHSNKYATEMEIRGRDIVTGLPRKIEVNSSEIREAIIETVDNITSSIKRILEKTPPELSADLVLNGIYLTGGGALLKGLDMYIEKETGLSVHVADDPLYCVAIGSGKICESM